MASERVLFDGSVGREHVRVWLDAPGSGIRLLSHDIGPGLEHAFGKDELETFLEIDGAHLAAVTAALRAERTEPDPPTDVLDLLADKYGGDSNATSAFRDWLTTRGIPHTFTLI